MENKSRQIFVFSDIHGCAQELKMLINKLPLTPQSLIIFLGDYIDRGPHSMDVVEVIFELKKKYDVVTLKGNHEQMLASFLEDPSSAEAGMFIYNGGSATLASYGDDYGNYNIPEEHLLFYTGLDHCYEDEYYFFVHAGVPDKPLHELDEHDAEDEMLWIRDSFIESRYNWGKIIVHGHTPDVKPQFTPRRINIDTGCVYNGTLTALQLPEKIVYSVRKQEELNHVYLRDSRSQRKATRFHGIIPVYIQKEDKILQFESINYTEFGMLMHDVVHHDKTVFDDNEAITGKIGCRSHEMVSFEGVVLRSKKKDDGIYYAVQFTKTPYDFLNTHFKKG